MTVIMRVLAIGVLLPAIASAGAAPDDKVVTALEHRNAEREAAFDARAARYGQAPAREEETSAREAHQPALEDHTAASDFREAQVRADKHASRKTGLVLM